MFEKYNYRGRIKDNKELDISPFPWEYFRARDDEEAEKEFYKLTGIKKNNIFLGNCIQIQMWDNDFKFWIDV